MEFKDPATRFSDRVDAYVKYRPGYPPEVYDYLQEKGGLVSGAEIADLGSGTGLLSKLFLRHNHRVYGVEPNAEMRSAGERLLADEREFRSFDGRAEAIPLGDASVDYVVAGQAFHWFEPKKTREEVRRILRANGQAALIWNEWNGGAGLFMQGYEKLLNTFGTDFKIVSRQSKQAEKNLRIFFLPHKPRMARFRNQQVFDLQGLRGRLLSSSYAPLEGHPQHAPMLAELEKLFEQHQENGRVRFDYLTSVYHGRMHDQEKDQKG